MYFSSPIFIISLLSTLVSSQQTSAVPTGSDLSGLPRCAAACAVNAFASMTSCPSDDYPCMCRDKKFTDKINFCIERGCDGEELKQAIVFAKSVCGSALVTDTSATSTSATNVSAEVTADATVTISTTSSGTATTTVAKSTTAKETPNSASGIRPGGFALGAWLLALFTL
ncbi:hypothetical protein B9Z19DRAFT_1093639 [Tuber borchii]|uniref:CFEM domain-containing protein n=1 Tax=Tuber borchii TaxID=42251 RepID=A0A2T6ZF39_TUBBO|nr:hypothetical protein B9Z19DRAFT_1093639 [Tuber borchii]